MNIFVASVASVFLLQKENKIKIDLLKISAH